MGRRISKKNPKKLCLSSTRKKKKGEFLKKWREERKDLNSAENGTTNNLINIDEDVGMDVLSKKGRYAKCCVCDAISFSNPERSYFRFPKDPERSKQWISALKKGSLLSVSVSELYNNFRVCSQHFEESSIASTRKRRLHRNAVPRGVEISAQVQAMSLKIKAKLNHPQETEMEQETVTEMNLLQEPVTDVSSVSVGQSTPHKNLSQRRTLKKTKVAVATTPPYPAKKTNPCIATNSTLFPKSRKSDSTSVLTDDQLAGPSRLTENELDILSCMSCDMYPAIDPESPIQIKQEPDLSVWIKQEPEETDLSVRVKQMPDLSVRVKQEPDLSVSIEQEPFARQVKTDIQSATMSQELDNCHKEHLLGSKDSSLFQPPVFIKDEIVSSEDEL